MLVERIADVVLPLFGVVAAGLIYARLRLPDMEAANRVNLDLFIPALVFSSLVQQDFELTRFGPLALGASLIIAVSGVAAVVISIIGGLRFRTLAPPMMFRNAGNLGLPLMTLTFGEEALPAALVLFLLGNVTHFGIAPLILDHRARWWTALAQPALLAALAALLVIQWEVPVPGFILTSFGMLGQIAIPLMQFSLGVRLSRIDLGGWHVGLFGALITPTVGVIAAMILVTLIPLPPMQAGMLFLFGALPPAVLNFLFAEQYRQEPARVASIVLLGNLSAVICLPLALAWVLPRYG
ncbi:MAG: AEC family transporter [Pseudomonadota bacterium]|nr:AEC family transporter [Pseudomonadota bacterium]